MAIATTEARAAATGRPEVRVLVDRCAGCQECVIRCPTEALGMDTDRWVATADSTRCVGCRQCVRTCPFSAIVVDGPALVATREADRVVHPGQLLGDSAEVRQGLPGWEAALAEAQRCLACPDPTCVRGCPAHNDIPGFVAAIREGDLGRAHEVLQRTSVLADVCSRVCNQAAQCEGACTWSLAGGTPVAIGQLERFVADNLPVPPPVPGPDADLSVGVVGAGPAAIGAAWALIESGAAVTVYEKDEVPAGLIDWGIPDFTLPEEVARRPWRQLEEAGVEVRCNVEIGRDGIDRLLGEHDAVIVATGASVPIRPPIPGSDLEGVTDATHFLKTAQAALRTAGGRTDWLAAMGLDRLDGTPGHVLVLGAGNTAMDVARTARRLGLDATCVDWVDQRFALARPDELAEAWREGVGIRFSRTVTRLEGEAGRARLAHLARTVQPRRDRPPKVVGDGETLRVDLVVMAMGYRVDAAIAEGLPGTPVRRQPAGVPDRRWTASGVLASPASAVAHHHPVGQLALGREVGLQAAALPVRARLWVVGDALVGPATVVEAMAQGRRAAAAIMAARPTGPARPGNGQAGPRRALVCYASEGGHTAGMARRVGDELAAKGVRVRVLPIDRVGPEELAATDLLVVGTWVEGLMVAKVGPSRAARAWLDALPRIGGLPAAVFCTYDLHPRSTLDVMAEALERRGARVVASSSLRRGKGDVAAIAFARRVLAGARQEAAAVAPSAAGHDRASATDASTVA